MSPVTPPHNNTDLNLSAVRRQLEGMQGPEYWRSLDELADTEGFREMLHREFPRLASLWTEGISRRKFLALMGASMALAGVGGCGVRPPPERIVPYIRTPENLVAGKPLFYATALSLAGIGTGVLVETHEGRPTKVEGNEDHPASLGATDVFSQATALEMYDPDRSQSVLHHGRISTWPEAVSALRAALETLRADGTGSGLRILTETVTSPTLARQIESLLACVPGARWHQYEPAGRDAASEGARMAFGQYYNTRYDFSKADIVLALDADFLTSGPGTLRYARQFVDLRRLPSDGVDGSPPTMNRLYVVESCPSATGAKADHRWPLQARQIETFTRALAARIDHRLASATPSPGSPTLPIADAWLDALADDLRDHQGRSIVVAGEQQPAVVHALAHAMNDVLNNFGQTAFVTEPIEARPENHTASLSELIAAMREEQVKVLLILGGNPAYASPADLDFATHLAATNDRNQPKIPFRLRLGLYENETSQLCDWHIPQAHPFEAWSDVRAFDGTASIVQPLIEPLYDGKSAHQLLAALTPAGERSSYDLVRETWRQHWASQHDAGDFETWWQTALHEGVIPGTAAASVDFTVDLDWLSAGNAAATEEESPGGGRNGNGSEARKDVEKVAKDGAQTIADGEQTLEVVFRPDSSIFDGRFANNGWLQELPRPLTKITWDNPVLISPATAEKFDLSYAVAGHGGEHGGALADIVELSYGGRTIEAPVWILPGHADDSVTLHLGYGRTRAGQVGTDVGFNAYLLRTSAAPWNGSGLVLRKTEKKHLLACTQQHHCMEGRRLVRSAKLDEYRTDPKSVVGSEKESSELPTLYQEDEYPYEGNKWGMAIDLMSCVGCNACVIACQAENNIPVVGKDQVTRGREMHWIRLDRYYQGEMDRPRIDFQPVTCMHCENAPCELVCPVGATVHSDEGLNDMIYNRCVGTRYCSNNCPYKVRRFNFLEYSHEDWNTPSLKLLRNPDVTVRSRGVMEKCTYCVQRINKARIEAEKEERPIRDGEIVTACQAVCPAKAITFGNLNDSNSEVVRQKKTPRNYGLLTELNTRPRTTYLGAVRNPNPAIQDESHDG